MKRAMSLLALAASLLFFPAAASASAVGLADGWCGDGNAQPDLSNAPKIRVIYAYAADQPNRLASVGPHIQRALSSASDQVTLASGGTLGVRWDRGSSCGTAYIDIIAVRLAHGAGHYAIADRTESLRRIHAETAAYNDGRALILADNMYSSGYGIAHTGTDSQPSPANGANYDARAAVIYGNGSGWFFADDTNVINHAYQALHEVFHTLGAVQPDAPNATSDGHTWSKYELLSKQSLAHPEVCPQSLISFKIDCHGDSYFNVNPAPGSYLATHWNVARSWYLCDVRSCASRSSAPDAMLATSTTSAPVGQMINLSAASSTDADGSEDIARYLFDLDGDGRFEIDNGGSPQLSAVLPRQGAIRAAVRVVDHSGAYGVASVGINVTPGGGGGGGGADDQSVPVGVISINPAANIAVGQNVTFSAAGSYSPSGKGVSFSWDLDGNGSADAGGLTARRSYPAAGWYRVTLTVRDSAGRVGIATETFQVGGGLTFAISRTKGKQKESSILRSGIAVKGSAPAAGTVKITVKYGKKTIGKATYKVKKAGNFTAKVKVNSAGRSALRANRKAAKLKVSATMTEGKAKKGEKASKTLSAK